jgi:membrane-associated protein
MLDPVVLALITIPKNLGYVALALLVGVEASGVPVPGETALIAASVLASQGHLEIWLVIPIAAAAAIIGDNVGYVLGSRLGRRVVLRPGRTLERRRALLERGDELFDRHGPKAVFFGRWIAGLRIWAAWLAGMTSMPWRSFLVWNALGGIAWAIFFGLLGYFGGEAAAHLVAKLGVWAALATGLVLLAVYGFIKMRRRRAEDRRHRGALGDEI